MALSSSTDRRRRTRKIATMMASPTATSAAATHITKNTSACPSAVPWRCPKATSARFAALSINSMDMKITSGSRRISTPSTPMLKSTADSATYQNGGIIAPPLGARQSRNTADARALLASHPALRERHDSHDRHQQQDGGDLEREQVVGEQESAHGLDTARNCRRGPH